MTSHVNAFLPPQQRVIALPNTMKPRMFLLDQSFRQRWRHSYLYPAFRKTARLYRLALRLKTALAVTSSYQKPGLKWELGEFLQPILPNVESVVVLLGTPGPVQKITVQLWDTDNVVGYLKFATKPLAQVRLAREHNVLSKLPDGIAPMVISYRAFNGGMALLTTPIAGEPVSASLDSTNEAMKYLTRLQQMPEFPIDQHPWVVRMRNQHAESIDGWLDALSDRSWPLVFQHGDFVPWNVIRDTDGRLTAIDWEYGTVIGFPKLDLAYYILQIAALMRRWSPRQARQHAVRSLASEFTTPQAAALVRLAAFESYQEALADGHRLDEPLQQWRRSVWAQKA